MRISRWFSPFILLWVAACGTAVSRPGAQTDDAATAADAADGRDDAADSSVDAAEDAEVSPDPLLPSLPPTLTEALVTATQAVLADQMTHGLTLTIDVPNHARWTQGIGFADAEHTVPILGLDHLRIGSITKTFVTAAVLRDVEAGKLNLDDAVAKLLPEISIDPAITVRMLLGHRSGLFNYSDDGTVLGATAQPITPEALYATAAKHPPEFAPGTAYKYSNTNFIVLGILLQKIHALPLQEWLRQTLWTPLKLRDVWLEGYEDVGLTHVPGYLAGQPPLPFDTSWAWAAGALAANGGDLCTWLRAVYFDRAVVGASSVEAMVTPSAESMQAGSAYGLGTMIDHRGGRVVVGHTGSTMGFNAEVYIDRSSGMCVAVLTNDFFGVRKAVGQKVWEVLIAGL